MDRFAVASHRRAIAAEDAGLTAQVDRSDRRRRGRGRDPNASNRDEGPRRDTSYEKLSTLKPAFEDEAAAARFPEIRWSVTAGNSSQVTDGAAATLIAEEGFARRLGLKPRAAITHFASPATIRS